MNEYPKTIETISGTFIVGNVDDFGDPIVTGPIRRRLTRVESPEQEAFVREMDSWIVEKVVEKETELRWLQ